MGGLVLLDAGDTITLITEAKVKRKNHPVNYFTNAKRPIAVRLDKLPASFESKEFTSVDLKQHNKTLDASNAVLAEKHIEKTWRPSHHNGMSYADCH